MAWRNAYVHWWERQKSTWWSREGYVHWQKEALKVDAGEARYKWDLMYSTGLVSSPEKVRIKEVVGHGNAVDRYPVLLVDMEQFYRLRKDGGVVPDPKKEEEIEKHLDRVWGTYCLTDTKKSTRRGGRTMVRSPEEAVVVPRQEYFSSPFS